MQVGQKVCGEGCGSSPGGRRSVGYRRATRMPLNPVAQTSGSVRIDMVAGFCPGVPTVNTIVGRRGSPPPPHTMQICRFASGDDRRSAAMGAVGIGYGNVIRVGRPGPNIARFGSRLADNMSPPRFR